MRLRERWMYEIFTFFLNETMVHKKLLIVFLLIVKKQI
ncbi:unnamed protein product [Paramecium sonneborni]|uniref:Uncharacterized protein n=1 Tax=Paramecium sonneborni TaxID=65129 RepID=A0A8S1R4A4_9CILI|nr:unnamed protein product [Paramecium sonneborni]